MIGGGSVFFGRGSVFLIEYIKVYNREELEIIL